MTKEQSKGYLDYVDVGLKAKKKNCLDNGTRVLIAYVDYVCE